MRPINRTIIITDPLTDPRQLILGYVGQDIIVDVYGHHARDIGRPALVHGPDNDGRHHHVDALLDVQEIRRRQYQALEKRTDFSARLKKKKKKGLTK